MTPAFSSRNIAWPEITPEMETNKAQYLYVALQWTAFTTATGNPVRNLASCHEIGCYFLLSHTLSYTTPIAQISF